MGYHYLMEHLAAHCPVVWMNPARDLRSVVRGGNGASEPSSHPNLLIYDHGPLLPHVWRPAALGDLTFQLRARRAARILRRRGCDRLIAYLWRPHFLPVLDGGRFDFSVYHISDEYSFLDDEQPLDPREVRTIKAVDQVFVHSPGLLEKKGRINPRTGVIPNGVEYDRFAASVPEPADLAGIPHPRIGYTGWLKRQLDWELLEELANRNSHWNFVFVGAQLSHDDIVPVIRRLEARRNVHFLGSKPSDELARYPQHFDCCIMPYRKTDYTGYIYPLKLHEYLAGGRPVVGTRIRSLEPLASVVALADDRSGWEAAVQQALDPEQSSADRTAQRQALAREHDWAVLTDRIAEALELPKRHA